MATTPAYTLRQMVAYALRLGALGFGGPVALVGYMHRDLVERRKWISEADFLDRLSAALCKGWANPTLSAGLFNSTGGAGGPCATAAIHSGPMIFGEGSSPAR